MILALESKKIKRTGFAAAFCGGGILSAAVPVLNMLFRSELYLSENASPAAVLMNANWQMMAMLNVLLIVVGACILYNIEYADNAMQRMRTLPLRESRLYFGKAMLAAGFCILLLLIETSSVAACAVYWFGAGREIGQEILQNFGFSLLALLPSVLLSLLISSLCRNMWISLGIGVICVLTAAMIPAGHFALTLFPFALPFQTLSGPAGETACGYAAACAAEIALISISEVILLHMRRRFE